METLSVQSPYPSRLHAWLVERFPYINFVSGALLYLLARAVLALSQDLALNLKYNDVIAALVPALHLFLLRVFDEHKDFASDQVHYPNRIVQRGIFTLKDIRTLGIAAFILQTICFFLQKPTAVAVGLWLLLWAWTLLMTKEFFAKQWLKSHFLIYSISHPLVTPILLLSMFGISSESFQLTNAVVMSLVLSICTGALYEISRKTKGKEEETGDLSYSQLWGSRKALTILSILTLVTAVVVEYLFQTLGLTSIGYRIALVVIVILTLMLHAKYFHSPTKKNRKTNEGLAALIAAYGFLVPLVVALLK